MAKRSRRSSHRRTKRHSTRSRRHHRARHTRRRGKRGGGEQTCSSRFDLGKSRSFDKQSQCICEKENFRWGYLTDPMDDGTCLH